jgi:hypothetical protein
MNNRLYILIRKSFGKYHLLQGMKNISLEIKNLNAAGGNNQSLIWKMDLMTLHKCSRVRPRVGDNGGKAG